MLGNGEGYLLYHSIGMYRGKAQAMTDALADFATGWGAPDDGQWMKALAARQAFLDRWGALINAPTGTLTSTENVTLSLYSLVGSLPRRYLKGKRVLVGADCFPSLHFLLAGLSDRFGFTLDTVPIRQGGNWVHDEDFIDRWGSDVGLALLTWVTSTASHRCDLETMVAHGRARGSLIGVDITQAVGLLPFDVMELAVDFTVSTSLKWLCGTPGAGILHVAPELLRQCRPELRGWFSQDDIFSWDLDKFEYAPDIRRFDHGTPSIVACAGSLPALEWHAAQDGVAMRAHNRALSERIIEGVNELGLMLVSPRSEIERGGSVMVRLPDAADPAEILGRLRARGVFADCRGWTLRLSPGPMTTQAGIDTLLETLRANI